MKQLLVILFAVLLAGCVAPLDAEVRRQLDPRIDYTAVRSAPQEHLGVSLLLGGSIVELVESDEGALLQIRRWHLTRSGEPLMPVLEDDRFLVNVVQPLDPKEYDRGRLVTLGGTLSGSGLVLVGGQAELVPVFELLDLHLWETPFRYGRHPNADPGAPEYVAPADPGPSHPYDPTPWVYPYAPHWYRNP